MKKKTPFAGGQDTTSNVVVDNPKYSTLVPKSTIKPTLSPRESRCVHALIKGPHMRENLDRAIGSSNSPDVVFRLRNKGIGIHCEKIPATDRDGNPCYPGRYSLTPDGRETLQQWGMV
ncbi:MAG: hypothetical protein ABW088_12550 [Sedimenticola sp.]